MNVRIRRVKYACCVQVQEEAIVRRVLPELRLRVGQKVHGLEAAQEVRWLGQEGVDRPAAS